MPRFFKSMPTPAAVGDTVTIDGQDAVHMRRSLRLREGDDVLLCDGRSTEYDTVIDAFEGDDVRLKVVTVRRSEAEPTVKVTLFQGLPKGDKLEWIIQKCVELGVCEIVPVEMSRSIAKIGDKAEKKQKRYQTIADEAASQSGRGMLPRVAPAVPFSKLPALLGDVPTVVCYEGGGKPFCDCISPDMTALNIVIGPEGGIAPEEIETLLAAGAVTATLGKRILRCETAPVAVMAATMAITGNWA